MDCTPKQPPHVVRGGHQEAIVMIRATASPRPTHEFHETRHSVSFYFTKKTPNDAVTPQRRSQFTPKMKANAVPRLLSSLV